MKNIQKPLLIISMLTLINQSTAFAGGEGSARGGGAVGGRTEGVGVGNPASQGSASSSGAGPDIGNQNLTGNKRGLNPGNPNSNGQSRMGDGNNTQNTGSKVSGGSYGGNTKDPNQGYGNNTYR
jgi:hypothetical protein